MKLYLIRHGDAISEFVDQTRPLSIDGAKEAQAVALYMENLGIRVSKVIHSGKTRAMQTAEILAERIAPGILPEGVKGLKPNDPPEALAHLVTTWENDALVATHLPFVGSLTSLLTTGSPNSNVADFPTGAVVCLERYNGDQWIINWLITPEMLMD